MMHKRPPFSSLRRTALERMKDERNLKLIRKARSQNSGPAWLLKRQLERIEDRLDAEDARKARKEPSIPWEQVKSDLGL